MVKLVRSSPRPAACSHSVAPSSVVISRVLPALPQECAQLGGRGRIEHEARPDAAAER
jgi:hypothetical protein